MQGNLNNTISQRFQSFVRRFQPNTLGSTANSVLGKFQLARNGWGILWKFASAMERVLWGGHLQKS